VCKTSILIVEDEQIIAFNLKSRLEKLGYEVVAFVPNGEEALKVAAARRPDLVLMDIMLEGPLDGVETATRLGAELDIPFIYLTASSDDATIARAKTTNPLGYLVKPFDENLLRITLEMALYKHSAEHRIRQAEQRIRKINDCLLGFGVSALDNITALLGLCGELLAARAVLYCRWLADAAPLQILWRDDGRAPRLIHRADCSVCFDIRNDPAEGVIPLDPQALARSCVAVQGDGAAAAGAGLGIALRDNGREIGVLTVHFSAPREGSMEASGLLGIISSAIRIEENRHAALEAQRDLQEQLVQSQKLEAIGTMAGGVAHEINNPLMGIINYAQLIVDRLPPDCGSLPTFAAEIIKEGERIAAIVRNLLAFARKDIEEPTPNRADSIINDALGLARRMLEKDEIGMVVTVPEGLPHILCKRQQIVQVLLNLLNNARDTSNARYPGYNADKRIFVEAALRTEAGKKMVRIDVRDQGEGIQPEIVSKLFDPFFSTKPRHLGTGLGLSVSYGIVKEHAGALTFDTVPGAGTTFHVDLPVVEG
jgi:signal transduction histidine kinase/AmiR/NasT family two-component response regulator